MGFPIPPFEWPRIGRQWPAYNVESDQADGLVMWLPWGGGYPGTRQHVDQIGNLAFAEGGTPAWVFDNEHGWSLLFDDGSTEYLQVGTAVVKAPPLTFSCWFWPDDTSNTGVLISVNDTAAGWNHFMMYADGNQNDRVHMRTRSIGGLGTAVATSAYTLNAWNHALGVCYASNDRAALVNGGNKGTDTTDITPADLDNTAIGREASGTPFWYFSGRIRDVRIYNRALTDIEAWQLYDQETRWELYQIPQPLWRLGVVAPPPPTAALPIFPPPDAIHSLVFGGVTVR